MDVIQVSATLKDALFSAQKGRLVGKEIRGLNVAKAMVQLEFTPKKAAKIIRKVLGSAIANAENNLGADIDSLFVSSVLIDEARSLKRFSARAKGRGNRILKRRCHIKIIVSDKKA